MIKDWINPWQSVIEFASHRCQSPRGWCSVGGAGGGGVVGGVAAGSDGVGEGVAGAVVDVPEVAEVDGVVVVAHGLGAGVSGNGAASAGAGWLTVFLVS